MNRGQSLILAFVLGGCGAPSSSDVRAAFLANHPAAAVTFVNPAEGADDFVYYDIRYRLPPDTTLWEQNWLYQKGADGDWRVTRRDSSIIKGVTYHALEAGGAAFKGSDMLTNVRDVRRSLSAVR